MAPAIRIRLKGRELAFPVRREITLGRDPKMDVRTDNPLVSRRHARLRPEQCGWVLEDTKSKHGTFVDGKPITRLPVTGPLTVWLAEPNVGEILLLLPEGTASGFFRRIEDAVGACQVFLVLIGRSWLTTTGPDGRRRLENPADFVRLELTAALRQGIRMIPLLVQDAQMPRPQELPEPLQELARRNAIKLSNDRWGYDVSRLVAAIEQSVKPQPSGRKHDGADLEQPTVPPPPVPRRRRLPWAWWPLSLIGGLIIGIVIIAIVAGSGA